MMSQRELESATTEELSELPSNLTLRQVVDHPSCEAFCIKDVQQRYVYCNPRMAKLLGLDASAVVGRTDEELGFHSNARIEVEGRVLRIGIAETLLCKVQIQGSVRWFNVNTIPLQDPGDQSLSGFSQWLHDVSNEHLEREIHLGQSRILQHIATGTQLESVLIEITQFVQELMPEALCSILIRDKQTNTLVPGFAPQVPHEYTRHLRNVPIADGVGSCGTAAFRAQTVITSDIEHDPKWRDYAAIALAHNLRACWSIPIFAPTDQPAPDQVLGTFAIYGHQTSEPRPEQLQILQVAAYLAGIVLDLSERQRIERASLETARLLSAVASGAGDAIFVKDLEGKYLFFNQAASNFVGKNVEDVIGQDDSKLFDPASYEFLQRIDRQVMESNQACQTQETLTSAGVTRTYLVEKTPYRDEVGNVIGLIGISRDITDRKLSEAALIASEERYRMAVQATREFIWDIDLLQTRVTWSERYEQVFGRSSDTANSWQWWVDNLHPEDRERTFACFQDAIANGHDSVYCEYRLKRKDGTWADVIDRAYIARGADGVAHRMVGAMRDVTEQKQEERLKLKLFRVIDQTDDFIILANVAGRIKFMNAGARQMVGVDVDTDVSLIHLHDFVAPAHIEHYWEDVLPQVLDRGRWEGEMQFVHLPDGRLLDVHGTIFLIHDEYGLPCIASVTRDITATKRAEKQLYASQQMVQAVLTASPITIYVLDLALNDLVFASWQLLTELGFSNCPKASLSWHDYQSLVHPDDLPGLLRTFERCQNAQDNEVIETEYRVRDAKNNWRWIVGRHAGFLNPADGKHLQIIGTAQDVTARKQLEHQVREAHKSDAIGRLAGGVAHDFNNLLTIINGHADLLLSKVHPENGMHSGLKEIRDAGQRAAQLTRQLLSFGRRAVVAPQILDLSAIILGSANLIRRFLGERISLDLQLQATDAFVVADPSQLDQLIFNLVLNARDAMPYGGVLTITTRRVSHQAIDAMHIPGATSGEYIEIVVRDVGTGMSTEVIERAFEPFFTTKPTGQGTGLGLAVVQGIVKQAGGYISLQSELGNGTTFTIWLPVTTDRPISSRPLVQSELKASLTNLKTVLIVEDEPKVRAVLRAALEAEGYRLLEACDPEDAMQLVEQFGVPIDLMVTDIVMPHESGQSLAKRIRAKQLDLPVLYVTGYSPGVPPTNESGLFRDRLLLKPFSPQELQSLVASMLQANEKPVILTE